MVRSEFELSQPASKEEGMGSSTSVLLKLFCLLEKKKIGKIASYVAYSLLFLVPSVRILWIYDPFFNSLLLAPPPTFDNLYSPASSTFKLPLAHPSKFHRALAHDS